MSRRRKQRSCGKIRYRDKASALAALRTIKAGHADGHAKRPWIVQSAYPCDRCNGWHLTRRT